MASSVDVRLAGCLTSSKLQYESGPGYEPEPQKESIAMSDYKRMAAVLKGEDPDALEKEVRTRLLSGVYKYPDPAWMKEYEEKNRGRMFGDDPCFPWAYGEVADFYGITDHKAMGKRLEEVAVLANVYRGLSRVK
jgi:hypothetical protein